MKRRVTKATPIITLEVVSLPARPTFLTGMASAWLHIEAATPAEIHVGYAEPGAEYTLATAIASHVRAITQTYATVGTVPDNKVPVSLGEVLDLIVTATAAARDAA